MLSTEIKKCFFYIPEFVSPTLQNMYFDYSSRSPFIYDLASWYKIQKINAQDI